MKGIKMFSERKEGKKWVYDGYACADEKIIYKHLAGMLIAKKLNHVAYPARLARVNNYDGTQTIIITQYNGYRWVFTIPDGI